MNFCSQLANPKPEKHFTVVSFLISVILALFYLPIIKYSLKWTGTVWPFVAATVAALFLLAALLTYWGERVTLPKRRIVGYICVIILVAVQLRFAMALYGTISFDFNYLFTAAKGLAWNGDLNGTEAYFAQFPNNLLLVLCFAFVIKVCTFIGFYNYMAALVLCSVISVDLSIYLAWRCAKKLWGRKYAFVFLLLSMPMIFFHYGIVCPYSDTFGMIFPAAFLFFLEHRPEKRAAAIETSLLMGAWMAIGYHIKPQTAIIVIAAFLIELFYCSKTRENVLVFLKRIALFLVGFIAAYVLLHLLFQLTTGSVLTEALKEEKQTPFTHYLMMGVNPDTAGFISDSDWEATMAVPGKKAKIAFNLQIIQERLQKMQLSGYLKLLHLKGKNTFSWMKIDMWVRNHNCQDNLSLFLQNWFCQGGQMFEKVWLFFLQANWVFWIMLWILPIVLGHGFSDPNVMLLRLTVMGLVMFELLFEAGQRYLFHLFPIYALLAVYGWRETATFVHKKMEEKHHVYT